ncbi:MAG: glycosyltransferase [bacterium]|nr:glycosyltransferase [Candidatus Sumerlaeota bacterium]
MPRPRVLHVYKDYYPPVFGGIEGTINLMARGTLDEYEVRVLVCSGSRRSTEEEIGGVRVTRTAEWGRLSNAPISPAFIPALRRAAAMADILHLHHPNPTGDIAYLIARPRLPVVMTYHSDIVRQKFSMIAFAPVQERVMRACRVIMPTSPNYIESSPWLARHRAKCRIVPLGVDMARFEPTTLGGGLENRAAEIRARYAAPITIFTGRLRYYKGLEYLIAAMKSLPGSMLIGGTGPDAQRLQNIARECGVAERAVFLGDLTDEELVAHLRAADVFCLPSHLRSEAFGLSQIEAMACGLPVVSTNIPTGVPFVNRDGETGFTVEPASPDALAAALEKLFNDDELRRRMGAAARLRAHSHFSAASMCRDLKDVYESVRMGQSRC